MIKNASYNESIPLVKRAREAAISRLVDLGLIDASTTPEELNLRLKHNYNRMTGKGMFYWYNGSSSIAAMCYDLRKQEVYINEYGQKFKA